MMPPTTLAEERQEAWTAALDGLRLSGADPDRAAACVRLIRHLIRSESAAPWCPGFRG